MKPARFVKLSLVAVTILGVATASAAQMFADLSGKWNVNVDGPQGPVASELELTQQGETVTGKFSSEIGVADVKGRAWGDSLRIAFEVDMGGQILALEVIGAAKDKDNLEGVVEAAGMGSFPFTAVRAQ
jgi:hypothetical protein